MTQRVIFADLSAKCAELQLQTICAGCWRIENLIKREHYVRDEGGGGEERSSEKKARRWVACS